MIGLDNLCGSDQEFAIMVLGDELPKTVLDVPPEIMRVACINSAVHESETIRWANYGVAMGIENRAVMNGDTFQGSAVLRPRIEETRFGGAEDDFHRLLFRNALA